MTARPPVLADLAAAACARGETTFEGPACRRCGCTTRFARNIRCKGCCKAALAAWRKKHRKTPHQRIMAAADAGTGVYLNPSEVAALAQDDAIAQVARNDDEGTDDR